MRRVDLFAIEVQEWQKVEIDRAQQNEAIDDVEFVSNLGQLQETIDQLGEMKRGECWVQRTELAAAEAERIRADKAQTTRQILGELHFKMCNKINRQGARVNLE